jgi:Mrp family chromosome partitioning ATPase
MEKKDSFKFSGLGLIGGLFNAQKKREQALTQLQRKLAGETARPKVPKAIRDGHLKVIVIYSGKGGVGKTTTTANIARMLVLKGHRVAILDADVNTPSMGIVFKKDNMPPPTLHVSTMGYEPGAYVQTSFIRAFFKKSIAEILKFKPEYLLIDTPPSITDVHISLLETLKPSGLILVTQPTELSMGDVTRTTWVFESRGVPVIGVVRSMVTPKSPATSTPHELLANIKFHRSFDGSEVFIQSFKEYERICARLEKVEEVILENKRRAIFDESEIDVEVMVRRQSKSDTYKMTFVNVSSWGAIREALMEVQDGIAQYSGLAQNDRFLAECTPERVSRLVKAFEQDEEAYFMVVRSPSVEHPLFPGEIGQCTMRQHPMYYKIPVVDYKTAHGVVTLFPYEVMPATQDMIVEITTTGGLPLKDGRYLPSIATLIEIENCYGKRVGLTGNWPAKYLATIADGDRERVQAYLEQIGWEAETEILVQEEE